MKENKIQVDSDFERKYRLLSPEQAEVREKTKVEPARVEITAYERALEEYRWYIRDPQAELPEEIMNELRRFGHI